MRDAANLFAMRFATVKSWRLLELASERVIAAAESAEPAKVRKATNAIEQVLRARPPGFPRTAMSYGRGASGASGDKRSARA